MTPINTHYSPMDISTDHQALNPQPTGNPPRDPKMEISNLLNDDTMQDIQEESQDNYQPHSEQHQRGRLHGLMDTSAQQSNPTIEKKTTASTAQKILISMVPAHITPEQQGALQQRLQSSQARLTHEDISLYEDDDEDDVHDYTDYNELISYTKKRSEFVNVYNQQRTHFVITRNSKTPGDKTYASDVALKQMARVEEVEDCKDCMSIPSKLPATITNSTVENIDTLKAVQAVFSKYENKEYLSLMLNSTSPNAEENNKIQQILNTPNGKIVTNLIRDFNTLAGTNYHINQLEIEVTLKQNIDDLDTAPLNKFTAEIHFTLSKLNESPNNS